MQLKPTMFFADFLLILPYNHLNVSTFKIHLKILFKKPHSNMRGITYWYHLFNHEVCFDNNALIWYYKCYNIFLKT